MIEIFLLLLNQQRSDILLAIRLRKAKRTEKFRLMSSGCPCCLRRMIGNTHMLSDEELQLEKSKLDETIADLISDVKIDQIL